jgi:hypothetical protein
VRKELQRCTTSILRMACQSRLIIDSRNLRLTSLICTENTLILSYARFHRYVYFYLYVINYCGYNYTNAIMFSFCINSTHQIYPDKCAVLIITSGFYLILSAVCFVRDVSALCPLQLLSCHSCARAFTNRFRDAKGLNNCE